RLNSSVTVASGASIGGFGTVNGNVVVQAGGSLAPGAPGGTFVVNGDLTLAQGSAMDFSFGQPGSSGAAGAGHSVQVNGSLALNGVRLSVNDAGGYGVGVYRLFDYTGSLTTGNGGFTGLAVGQTVQVYNGQINLINARNLTLNLWNADRTATATQQGGGSGVWSKNSANWTDVDATVTSAFSPSNAFAIFGGTAGTVTVDGSAGNVSTSGAQFLSDGYRLNGDALNLVAPSAGALSEVRVGDGSAASADWTATLDTVVAGNGLDKTGLGTLVLNGTNTYAQTRLSAGTLSVSSDANLGAASGGAGLPGRDAAGHGHRFREHRACDHAWRGRRRSGHRGCRQHVHGVASPVRQWRSGQAGRGRLGADRFEHLPGNHHSERWPPAGWRWRDAGQHCG
ncbi:autotransporter-associated beta strand repeat-containing protein, partial [Bordetella avium]